MKETHTNKKGANTTFTEWLEKLQQESWQLELLISGFALFAIWEARTLIAEYNIYQELNLVATNEFSRNLYNNFGIILLSAWRIFFFNLLIHVFARGLWIGAIGLRYVSAEIDFQYFGYAPIFENYLKKQIGSFDSYIEKLERFSSVIFAYTFLLFFIFLSLQLFFLEFSAVMQFLGEKKWASLSIFFTFFLMVIGGLTFVDFITTGGLKEIKNKYFSRFYFVVYRIFSLMTLSFLYRPLLYNFWDEKYTRRLFFISIPYIFLLVYSSNFSYSSITFFPIKSHATKNHNDSPVSGLNYRAKYYDDEREKIFANDFSVFKQKLHIHDVSLESKVLSGSYTSIFLRSTPNDADWLAINKGITPFENSGFQFNFIGNKKLKDSTEIKLNREMAKAIKTFYDKRRAINKLIKSTTSKQNELEGTKIVDGKSVLDEAYWEAKIDSTVASWKPKRALAIQKKHEYLLQSILALHDIQIDNVPYNDSCDCSFYIHPNLGEKGLLCHFPMKNLKEGKHILKVARDWYSVRAVDSLNTTTHHIPFMKINKDY